MRKLAGAVCFLAAVWGTPAAHACYNGVEIEVDRRVQEVSNAINALGRDRPQDAAGIVLRAYPGIRTARIEANPLQARAMRVLATAVVRLDGAVRAGKDWTDATSEAREGNYTWAVRVLRGLSIRTPTDPSLMTDLAEALSARPTTRAEARRILELLAPRDLIATAYGWAALARVRLAAGDVNGRAEAVARCAKMARTIDVCKVRGEAAGAGT